MGDSTVGPTDGAPFDPLATQQLLSRHRDGDESAADVLLARYRPMLQAWARGRLPDKARSLADTDDLVQVVLLRALANLDRFESNREGAFLAYLRTIYFNAVREELRKSQRRGEHVEVEEDLVAPAEVDADLFTDYERALATLSPLHREAVILRIEFGYPYAEIADAMGAASANASRMLVTRALLKLAEAMDA